jgi:hypothetical protein
MTTVQTESTVIIIVVITLSRRRFFCHDKATCDHNSASRKYRHHHSNRPRHHRIKESCVTYIGNGCRQELLRVEKKNRHGVTDDKKDDVHVCGGFHGNKMQVVAVQNSPDPKE